MLDLEDSMSKETWDSQCTRLPSPRSEGGGGGPENS